MVLGAGLEPACLSAYGPQTYVSAIPPPERFWKLEDGTWETESRKRFCRAKEIRVIRQLMPCFRPPSQSQDSGKSMSMSMSTTMSEIEKADWIKLDLQIPALEDPGDRLDYSA